MRSKITQDINKKPRRKRKWMLFGILGLLGCGIIAAAVGGVYGTKQTHLKITTNNTTPALDLSTYNTDLVFQDNNTYSFEPVYASFNNVKNTSDYTFAWYQCNNKGDKLNTTVLSSSNTFSITNYNKVTTSDITTYFICLATNKGDSTISFTSKVLSINNYTGLDSYLTAINSNNTNGFSTNYYMPTSSDTSFNANSTLTINIPNATALNNLLTTNHLSLMCQVDISGVISYKTSIVIDPSTNTGVINIDVNATAMQTATSKGGTSSTTLIIPYLANNTGNIVTLNETGLKPYYFILGFYSFTILNKFMSSLYGIEANSNGTYGVFIYDNEVYNANLSKQISITWSLYDGNSLVKTTNNADGTITIPANSNNVYNTANLTFNLKKNTTYTIKITLTSPTSNQFFTNNDPNGTNSFTYSTTYTV